MVVILLKARVWLRYCNGGNDSARRIKCIPLSWYLHRIHVAIAPDTVDLDIPSEVAVMDAGREKGAIGGRAERAPINHPVKPLKLAGNSVNRASRHRIPNYGRGPDSFSLRPDVLSKVCLKHSQMSRGGSLSGVWEQTRSLVNTFHARRESRRFRYVTELLQVYLHLGGWRHRSWASTAKSGRMKAWEYSTVLVERFLRLCRS